MKHYTLSGTLPLLDLLKRINAPFPGLIFDANRAETIVFYCLDCDLDLSTYNGSPDFLACFIYHSNGFLAYWIFFSGLLLSDHDKFVYFWKRLVCNLLQRQNKKFV